jgi:hypothetical protein
MSNELLVEGRPGQWMRVNIPRLVQALRDIGDKEEADAIAKLAKARENSNGEALYIFGEDVQEGAVVTMKDARIYAAMNDDERIGYSVKAVSKGEVGEVK